MSVVNRMLLDIDRRLGAESTAAWRSDPAVRVASAPARAAGVRAFSVLLPVLAAATAFVAWDAWRRPASETMVPHPTAALAAATGDAPAPRLAAPAARVDTAIAALPAEVAAAESARAPRTTHARAPGSFKMTTTLSAALAEPAPPAPSPVPSVAAAVRPQRVDAPVRHVASEETVSTARALWNEGARSSALATLRDALAAAEASGDSAAARPLARELARLQVADNRPQPALELLKRYEAALGDDADMLALRGNAQQRLGLNNDAALSYLAALRLRPGEVRWMLGAAVSLAADGKLDEAQRWIDRAQERGAVPPDVAAYLRQLGLAAR